MKVNAKELARARAVPQQINPLKKQPAIVPDAQAHVLVPAEENAFPDAQEIAQIHAVICVQEIQASLPAV